MINSKLPEAKQRKTKYEMKAMQQMTNSSDEESLDNDDEVDKSRSAPTSPRPSSPQSPRKLSTEFSQSLRSLIQVKNETNANEDSSRGTSNDYEDLVNRLRSELKQKDQTILQLKQCLEKSSSTMGSTNGQVLMIKFNEPIFFNRCNK